MNWRFACRSWHVTWWLPHWAAYINPGSSLILCSSRPCYNAYPCHHFGNHPLATVRQDGQHGQVECSGFPGARLGASEKIRKGEQDNAVFHNFLQNQCVETVLDAGIAKHWTVSLVISYPYHRAGPQASRQALALNFAWKMECRKANDSTSRITQASARPWGFLMMSFQSRPFKHETNLRIQVCRVSTQLARAFHWFHRNIQHFQVIVSAAQHETSHLSFGFSQSKTDPASPALFQDMIRFQGQPRMVLRSPFQKLVYCNFFSSGV